VPDEPVLTGWPLWTWAAATVDMTITSEAFAYPPGLPVHSTTAVVGETILVGVTLGGVVSSEPHLGGKAVVGSGETQASGSRRPSGRARRE
jgi:hypothetical protein